MSISRISRLVVLALLSALALLGALSLPAATAPSALAQGRATCLHDLSSFPLECLGAEPFFILTIAGARAEYARMGHAVETWYAADCRYEEAEGGALDKTTWRLPLRDLDSNDRGEAIVRHGRACDIGYQDTAFEAELELTTPAGALVRGCCQLRPHTGKETLPFEHPSQ